MIGKLLAQGRRARCRLIESSHTVLAHHVGIDAGRLPGLRRRDDWRLAAAVRTDQFLADLVLGGQHPRVAEFADHRDVTAVSHRVARQRLIGPGSDAVDVGLGRFRCPLAFRERVRVRAFRCPLALWETVFRCPLALWERVFRCPLALWERVFRCPLALWERVRMRAFSCPLALWERVRVRARRLGFLRRRPHDQGRLAAVRADNRLADLLRRGVHPRAAQPADHGNEVRPGCVGFAAGSLTFRLKVVLIHRPLLAALLGNANRRIAPGAADRAAGLAPPHFELPACSCRKEIGFGFGF